MQNPLSRVLEAQASRNPDGSPCLKWRRAGGTPRCSLNKLYDALELKVLREARQGRS